MTIRPWPSGEERWWTPSGPCAVRVVPTTPVPAPTTTDGLAQEPIRVLVVDDHALFRRGLEIVLAQEEDIQVVGEAGDGSEAVDKAADLLPDIILMDVRMPKRGGIEACTSIKEVAPARRSSC